MNTKKYILDYIKERGELTQDLLEEALDDYEFQQTKQIPLQEQVNIFREFIVSMHTHRWTGHMEDFWKCIEKAGAFSYGLTNSYAGQTDGEFNALYNRNIKNLIS